MYNQFLAHFFRNLGFQIFGKTKILEEALHYVREHVKECRYICVDVNPLSNLPPEMSIRYQDMIHYANSSNLCDLFFQNEYFSIRRGRVSTTNILLFRSKKVKSYNKAALAVTSDNSSQRRSGVTDDNVESGL